MVKNKECPPDKILNPDTNRCVFKNGPVGKKLLKNLISIKPKKELKEQKVKKTNLDFLTSMSNNIDKIEEFFNIQNKKAINEITNYIYTCFDNNKHQFNNENIKKFIKLCDTYIKSVCEKLIENSFYISLYEFLLIIKANVYNLISNYINDEDFESHTIYIYSVNLNDNNKWINLYVANLIKYITNFNISITFINSNDEISSIKPNDIVLFVDDCYYTGNELKNIIKKTYRFWNDKIKFIVLVPYISNEAIRVIKKSFNKFNLNFAKYKKIIIPVKKFIDKKEIKLLNYYYDNQIDFSDTYMIYFTIIWLMKKVH